MATCGIDYHLHVIFRSDYLGKKGYELFNLLKGYTMSYHNLHVTAYVATCK